MNICIAFLFLLFSFSVHAQDFVGHPATCPRVLEGTDAVDYTRLRSLFDRRKSNQGRGFKVPEFQTAFRILNHEIKKKMKDGLPQRDRLYPKYSKKMAELQSTGYPYEKSMNLLFEAVFMLDEVKLHSENSISQLLSIERGSVGIVLQLAHKRGFFVLPTFRELSIEEINSMMVNGFLPLGLVLTATEADGDMYDPTGFFDHDLVHAQIILNRVDSKYVAADWAKIIEFLALSQKLPVQRRYSNNILVFSIFHEMGLSIPFLHRSDFDDHYDPVADVESTVRATFFSVQRKDKNRLRRLHESDYKRSVAEFRRVTGFQ